MTVQVYNRHEKKRKIQQPHQINNAKLKERAKRGEREGKKIESEHMSLITFSI